MKGINHWAVLASTISAVFSLNLPIALRADVRKRSQMPLALSHFTDQAPLESSDFMKSVKDFYGMVYIAQASIGTPPQRINVSLGLAENGFLVPGDFTYFCSSDHKYNHTLSTTYTPNGTKSESDFFDTDYIGFISQDLVNVAGVEISGVAFEEFTACLLRNVGGWQIGFEGVLGLAPPWRQKTGPRDSYAAANILSVLQERELLDENLFALRLPRNMDDRGEFSLGSTNPDLYIGDLARIPLVDDEEIPHQQLRGLWTLPLEKITLDTEIPMSLETPNYTVTFASEPVIVLPTELYRNFSAALGSELGGLYGWHVLPCDQRYLLPNITFTMAGHDISVRPLDYTYELETMEGTTCLLWIGDAAEWSRFPHVISLSYHFLKGLYSVFDFGRKEIGFAELKR